MKSFRLIKCFIIRIHYKPEPYFEFLARFRSLSFAKAR